MKVVIAFVLLISSQKKLLCFVARTPLHVRHIARQLLVELQRLQQQQWKRMPTGT